MNINLNWNLKKETNLSVHDPTPDTDVDHFFSRPIKNYLENKNRLLTRSLLKLMTLMRLFQILPQRINTGTTSVSSPRHLFQWAVLTSTRSRTIPPRLLAVTFEVNVTQQLQFFVHGGNDGVQLPSSSSSINISENVRIRQISREQVQLLKVIRYGWI